ncbi:hypothetical protein ACJX0J_037579, partial [Zea mays]
HNWGNWMIYKFIMFDDLEDYELDLQGDDELVNNYLQSYIDNIKLNIFHRLDRLGLIFPISCDIFVLGAFYSSKKVIELHIKLQSYPQDIIILLIHFSHAEILTPKLVFLFLLHPKVCIIIENICVHEGHMLKDAPAAKNQSVPTIM